MSLITNASNKKLYQLWSARVVQRQKNLRKLRKSAQPRPVKIQQAEYRLLVARKKANFYKLKANGQKPIVRRPAYAVNRSQFANVEGHHTPKRVILHSTESHDHPGTADGIGILKYLENNGLGIHDVVDKEGLVYHGADYHDLVSHARGANTGSIGIEQIGFAHSTEWKRKDRTEQLEKVAKLLAYYNKEFGIPLKYSTDHGVARHADFPLGGHSDPGTIGKDGEYPLFYVLRLAQSYRKRGW